MLNLHYNTKMFKLQNVYVKQEL